MTVWKWSVLIEEEDLAETFAGALVQGACRLRRETKTGACLKVQLFTVNGTELGGQEWRDSLFLIYGLETLYFPHYCDGCNATFSIYPDLDCNWCGLVTARHNALCDGVADLSSKDFTPSHVRNDPLIFAGCAVKRLKANPAISKATTVPDATPPLYTT